MEIVIVLILLVICVSSSISGGIAYYVSTQQEQETKTTAAPVSSKTTPAPVSSTTTTTPAPVSSTTTTTPAPVLSTTTAEPVLSTTTTSPILVKNSSYQCVSNDVGGGDEAVYRYVGDSTLRHYPDPDNALKWGGNVFSKIDCDGLEQGSKMYTKPKDGDAIKCTANDVGAGEGTAVYRYVGDNTLRHYPDGEIAKSWDPNWKLNHSKIDCLGLTKGLDMEMKQ